MRIYSDTLERMDLYRALPDKGDVYLTAKEIGRPRIRAHGWIVRLEALRPNGRNRNSGKYGAENVKAATYQEHGLWMARLFDLDPCARIAEYDGRAQFEEETRKATLWGPHYAAPWLEETERANRANGAVDSDDRTDVTDAERDAGTFLSGPS